MFLTACSAGAGWRVRLAIQHGQVNVCAISWAVAVLAFGFGVMVPGAVTATVFLNFVAVSVQLIGLALGKPPGVAELLRRAMAVMALLAQTMASRPGVGGAAAHNRGCASLAIGASSTCATS